MYKNKKIWGSIAALLSALAVLVAIISGQSLDADTKINTPQISMEIGQTEQLKLTVTKDGNYDGKKDVQEYLTKYHCLPSNYITKTAARELGWNGGGLDSYQYGACIGGDYFGNYEGYLPKKDGRSYYECDIDTMHKDSRGAKRIVYSDDGLIYYTEDHYQTFELLAQVEAVLEGEQIYREK